MSSATASRPLNSLLLSILMITSSMVVALTSMPWIADTVIAAHGEAEIEVDLDYVDGELEILSYGYDANQSSLNIEVSYTAGCVAQENASIAWPEDPYHAAIYSFIAEYGLDYGAAVGCYLADYTDLSFESTALYLEDNWDGITNVAEYAQAYVNDTANSEDPSQEIFNVSEAFNLSTVGLGWSSEDLISYVTLNLDFSADEYGMLYYKYSTSMSDGAHIRNVKVTDLTNDSILFEGTFILYVYNGGGNEDTSPSMYVSSSEMNYSSGEEVFVDYFVFDNEGDTFETVWGCEDGLVLIMESALQGNTSVENIESHMENAQSPEWCNSIVDETMIMNGTGGDMFQGETVWASWGGMVISYQYDLDLNLTVTIHDSGDSSFTVEDMCDSDDYDAIEDTCTRIMEWITYDVGTEYIWQEKEEESEVYFVCRNGDEIPFDWVNDGYEDCSDGSDESQDFDGDGTTDNWFDCHDGTNVSMDLVNDGSADCPDGEDEGEGDSEIIGYHTRYVVDNTSVTMASIEEVYEQLYAASVQLFNEDGEVIATTSTNGSNDGSVSFGQLDDGVYGVGGVLFDENGDEMWSSEHPSIFCVGKDCEDGGGDMDLFNETGYVDFHIMVEEDATGALHLTIEKVIEFSDFTREIIDAPENGWGNGDGVVNESEANSFRGFFASMMAGDDEDDNGDNDDHENGSDDNEKRERGSPDFSWNGVLVSKDNLLDEEMTLEGLEGPVPMPLAEDTESVYMVREMTFLLTDNGEDVQTLTLADDNETDDEEDDNGDCEYLTLYVHGREYGASPGDWYVHTIFDGDNVFSSETEDSPRSHEYGCNEKPSDDITISFSRVIAEPEPEPEPEPVVNAAPTCDVFWFGSDDNLTDGTSGGHKAVERMLRGTQTGNFEIELTEGETYTLMFYCVDDEGDEITVTATPSLTAIPSKTMSGNSPLSGLYEFTIPAGTSALGEMLFDYDWTDGTNSGDGTVSVEVLEGSAADDTESDDTSAGSFVPGFTAVLTMTALAGAFLVFSRRQEE